MTSGGVGRRRRAPEEVDAAVLLAARAVFARKGFATATVREVAQAAGVHEPAVYRRHESKVALFRAAVLIPFSDVISRYLDIWSGQLEEPLSLRELVTAFIDPLYDLLRTHSELALAIAHGPRDQPEGSDVWASGLGLLLDRLVPQLELEAGRRHLVVDARTTNVVVLGMVLGVALLDPVRASDPDAVNPAAMRDAMVDLVLHGVAPGRAA